MRPETRSDRLEGRLHFEMNGRECRFLVFCDCNAMNEPFLQYKVLLELFLISG